LQNTRSSFFKPGGEHAGIEEILDRHADLKVARSIYRACVEQYPGRLIMLCDSARVLARSDRPETMPWCCAADVDVTPIDLIDSFRCASSLAK
jgi:hypothetical protein